MIFHQFFVISLATWLELLPVSVLLDGSSLLCNILLLPFPSLYSLPLFCTYLFLFQDIMFTCTVMVALLLFFLGENGVFLWILLGSRTGLQSILIPSQQLMFLWVLLYMLTICLSFSAYLPVDFYHVLYIHTLKIVTANGQRDHPAAQVLPEVAS